MFKVIFQSLKKSSQLRKVSKKLSQPFDFNNLFQNGATSKNHLDELISIARADSSVKSLLDENNVDDSFLKELYSQLVLAGAGQYASGHYVAASSIVFAYTLKFLLKHFDGERFSIRGYDHYNSSLFIANRLYDYFKNGETTEIKY